ncbi:MAG: hypothetical protein ACI8W7_001757, partial [Gammaproteobacteria bacterium]
MPESSAAGRGAFGVRWNDLLKAIFPLMPDPKHIDFRFVYEIASQIVPYYQIAHQLWIRRSFNFGAQQWKFFQLSDAIQDIGRRFLCRPRILGLDELAKASEIANRLAGIAEIHLSGGLSSSPDPQLSSQAFTS